MAKPSDSIIAETSVSNERRFFWGVNAFIFTISSFNFFCLSSSVDIPFKYSKFAKSSAVKKN